MINYCQVIRYGKVCGRVTQFLNGKQCAACRQWKWSVKNKDKERLRCQKYHANNRELRKIKRREKYLKNRQYEILSVLSRRYNKRKENEA